VFVSSPGKIAQLTVHPQASDFSRLGIHLLGRVGSKQANSAYILPTYLFFLENAGELRLIILRGEKGESPNNPTNTTHTQHTHTHALISFQDYNRARDKNTRRPK
jgi:hypothetical protein